MAFSNAIEACLFCSSFFLHGVFAYCIFACLLKFMFSHIVFSHIAFFANHLPQSEIAFSHAFITNNKMLALTRSAKLCKASINQDEIRNPLTTTPASARKRDFNALPAKFAIGTFPAPLSPVCCLPLPPPPGSSCPKPPEPVGGDKLSSSATLVPCTGVTSSCAVRCDRRICFFSRIFPRI